MVEIGFGCGWRDARELEQTLEEGEESGGDSI
jgi:hypothetical protein